MFTEDSSEQLTPLPEEHAEPPAPQLGEAVLPIQEKKIPLMTPWAEVSISVGVWFLSVLMLLLVPVVFALPYMIYRIVKTGPAGVETIASDKLLIFFSVAGILPTHLLTFVLVWAVVTYLGRRPLWPTIGFEWPRNSNPPMMTLVCVLIAIILFGLAWGVTYLYGDRKTDLDLLIESSNYTRFATAIVAVATAPLVEELIYRGVLYGALEKAAGAAVAIPVVSLLFAGVHVFQYRNNVAIIVMITLLSITLTVARAVTGKVLPAFVIHLVFNGILSVLIVLGAFIDKDLIK